MKRPLRPPGTSSDGLTASEPNETGTRILIVDDEKRILELFSFLLHDFGYSIQTAAEPEKALALVAKDKFEIVFLDQFLGGTKGLDLMEKMGTVDPDLSFVIISGENTTDLAIRALKRGAADFIGKPFFIADLVKSIQYVLKKKAMEKREKELVLKLSSTLDQRTEELRNVYLPVLASLAQAMEKKDIGTYGHSLRVRHYSCLIAAALDLSDEEREELKMAAMLHDIGKIGTSDFILGKPGPLNEQEIKIVRSHPMKGVEILGPLKKIIPQLEVILPAILHHHENYDGSGYPHGLAGQDIPLLARIITVADAYDAILSDRPYRTAANHGQAVAELSDHAGTQFDPHVVHAFMSANQKYDKLFSQAGQ